MGYAINQYNGMRAIDDASALLAGESYCDELPTPWPPAPTLAQAQAAQVAVLHAACAAAITGGFQSAALGSSYAYPSDLTSQGNQSTVASSPSGGALWAQPAGGVWALMPHSQAEAQAVVASFVAFLNANQQQLATYTANVNSAATPDAASAVVWEAI